MLSVLSIAMRMLIPASDVAVADTVFLEVGSSRVNGSLFQPHAARVRVYAADGKTLTADWTNELSLGDSAGRKVMRWTTTSNPIPELPNRPLSVLRQTYDAITLAPYGYNSQSSNGGYIRLTLNGKKVIGVRRAPADTSERTVSVDLDRAGFVVGASDLVPVAAGMKLGEVMVAPMWGPNMTRTEDRVFTVVKDTTVDVEGTPQKSRVVTEHRRTDRTLMATWYLTFETPYMVYGEVPLANGGVQRMTEVLVPMKK